MAEHAPAHKPANAVKKRAQQPAIAKPVPLTSPGAPLDDGFRSDMEARFGHDFSRVRVHTDSAAADSARDLGAKAYTHGNEIVFARGNYSPQTHSGRRSLAHELAHVVQQSRGGAVPRLDPASHLEHAADHAADQAVSPAAGPASRPLAVQGASAVGVARQADEEQAHQSQGQDQGLLGITVPEIVGLLTRYASVNAAVEREFLSGLFGELLIRAKGGVAELAELKNPLNLAAFGGSYLISTAIGLVSPLTDLAGLGELAEQLPTLAANAYIQRAGLAADLAGMSAQFRQLETNAAAEFRTIWNDRAELGRLLDRASGPAVAMARNFGVRAADGIADVVGGAQGAEVSGHKPSGVLDALSHPISTAFFAAETAEHAVFSAKWSKRGNLAGKLAGSAVANVALFVFTDGIGDAVTQVAAQLGKLGGILADVERGVAGAGKAITAIEEFIGGVMSRVLKPLGKALEPLGELLQRLRQFLRRLAGVAERDTTLLAEKLGEKAPKQLPAKQHAATSAEPTHAAPAHQPKQPAHEPEPTPAQVHEPTPEPAPVNEPSHDTEPTPTHDTQPQPAPSHQPTPEPESVQAAAPEPAKSPEPVTARRRKKQRKAMKASKRPTARTPSSKQTAPSQPASKAASPQPARPARPPKQAKPKQPEKPKPVTTTEEVGELGDPQYVKPPSTSRNEIFELDSQAAIPGSRQLMPKHEAADLHLGGRKRTILVSTGDDRLYQEIYEGGEIIPIKRIESPFWREGVALDPAAAKDKLATSIRSEIRKFEEQVIPLENTGRLQSFRYRMVDGSRRQSVTVNPERIRVRIEVEDYEAMGSELQEFAQSHAEQILGSYKHHVMGRPIDIRVEVVPVPPRRPTP